MVEGPLSSGGGLISFPGIVPAAINEASEIMAQLNKPIVTQTDYIRDKRGNVLSERTYQVTPLAIMLCVMGPAAVFAVLRILELAAGVGKSWAPGDIAGAASEAAKGLVDQALDAANEAGEGTAGVISRLWGGYKQIGKGLFFGLM